MPGIELRDVVKAFDGHRALDGLCMTAPAGAVYGFVGPNGAGKTTAIRHMAGILRADAGTVLIDGSPVFENPAVKERLVLVPDEPYFFTQATTLDMLRFTRSMYPRFDSQRYEKLGEAFPIDQRQPIRRMSRGMRKQAAFRVALAMRPELLLLDEPVDGLDPVMRRQVWSLVLADVAEYGTTVLVSSHNLRELEDVCDHVGIVNHGRCLLERPLSELQENMVKILIALPEGGALPEGLDILHRSATGRLQTLILRGRAPELTARLAAAEPLFMDAVPLSLEEIFIYELGGADYAVKDILF